MGGRSIGRCEKMRGIPLSSFRTLNFFFLLHGKWIVNGGFEQRRNIRVNQGKQMGSVMS